LRTRILRERHAVGTKRRVALDTVASLHLRAGRLYCHYQHARCAAWHVRCVRRALLQRHLLFCWPLCEPVRSGFFFVIVHPHLPVPAVISEYRHVAARSRHTTTHRAACYRHGLSGFAICARSITRLGSPQRLTHWHYVNVSFPHRTLNSSSPFAYRITFARSVGNLSLPADVNTFLLPPGTTCRSCCLASTAQRTRHQPVDRPCGEFAHSGLAGDASRFNSDVLYWDCCYHSIFEGPPLGGPNISPPTPVPTRWILVRFR